MHFNLRMISYPEFMGIMNKGSCCCSHCKSLKKKNWGRGRLETAKEQGTVVSISCSSDQKLKGSIKYLNSECCNFASFLAFKVCFLMYDFLVVQL